MDYYDRELEWNESSEEGSSEETAGSDTSGIEIIVTKRNRAIRLPSTSTRDEDIIPVAREDNYEPWVNVTPQDSVPHRINFTSDDKAEGPQIPVNCGKPIDFFKLFFCE